MANPFKIPTPADLLRAASPRTGPPVANMGGIPTQGMAPQRVILPAQPSINAGPPGPAPAAVPPAVPAVPTSAPATAQTAPVTPGSAGPVFNFQFGGAPPAAPRPGEMWPDAQAPPAPTTNAGGGLWPDASEPQAPPIPDAPYKVARSIPHVPRRFELDSLAPGEGVTMPLGDAYRDTATGKLKIKLNDAGKAEYRKLEQDRLRKFSPYPMSHDPAAPTPDVTPGQPVFDPFKGAWL